MTKAATTILVIEDDEKLGKEVVRGLEDVGHRVVWETDGKLGFDRLVKEEPSLVLLDIALPSMDGFEILERKQENKKVADIPVIVVSNSMQEVEISRATDLGAKKYISKAGISPEEIVKKVEECLETTYSTKEKEATTLSEKNILLVEDEPFLRDLLSIKFAKLGCELHYATDGEASIASIAATKPDIVLLDLLLPAMSGFDVLDHIRKNPDTAQLPVIVLSNLGEQKDVEKAKASGATDFLVKAHHSIDEIVAKVQAHLS